MIAAADKNADGKVDYEGTVRGLQLREKKRKQKKQCARFCSSEQILRQALDLIVSYGQSQIFFPSGPT